MDGTPRRVFSFFGVQYAMGTASGRERVFGTVACCFFRTGFSGLAGLI